MTSIQEMQPLYHVETYKAGNNPKIDLCDHLNEKFQESTIQVMNSAAVYHDQKTRVMVWEEGTLPELARRDFFDVPDDDDETGSYWGERICANQVFIRSFRNHWIKKPVKMTTEEGLILNLQSMVDTLLIFHENDGELVTNQEHIDEGYTQYSDHYDWGTCLEFLAIEPPRISSTIGLGEIHKASIFDHIDEIILCCGFGGPNLYLSIYIEGDSFVWEFTGKWEESVIIKGNYQIAAAVERDRKKVDSALDSFAEYLWQMIQDHK